MKKLFPLLLFFSFLIFTHSLTAQTRIAVFPFMNKDGNFKFNIWCYKFQDSLTKALFKIDPDKKYFDIVPSDSIESLLAELNLDPNNPEYQSDMWKAAKMLNIKWVVMGNFNINAGTFLIDCYAYNVRTKLANQKYHAKDIFKKEDKVMECIDEIVTSIIPLFIPQK